jgi:hypothetical protein
MEISGYAVEIQNGKHISDPATHKKPEASWWRPFSYLIGTSDEVESCDRSYVEMQDGANYGVIIHNKHNTRCYATIKIDGNVMGRWLLNPNQRAVIERPVDIDKKFAFYKVSSEGGQAAGLLKHDSNNGLVEVEFVPEIIISPATLASYQEETWGTRTQQQQQQQQQSQQQQQLPQYMRSFNSNNRKNRPQFRASFNDNLSNVSSDKGNSDQLYEEGGTGLCGKSNQVFGVAEILNLNYNESVTITLRLIARKLALNYDDVTPLPRRNAVPPPIWS